MKAWWLLRSRRERIYLTCLGMFMLCMGFVSLNHSVIRFKKRVRLEESQLALIENSHKRLLMLKTRDSQSFSSKKLQLEKYHLNKYLSSYKRMKLGMIRYVFDQVPFDTLIAWVRYVNHQYPLILKKITIIKTPLSGTVNAEIIWRISNYGSNRR